MFGLSDLIVINAIEDGLANLRANPMHLDFILGMYEHTPFMRALHGSAYIRQCKEFVLNNKIFVKPYYVYDLAKMPSIAVIAQYAEDLQFIGDTGFSEFEGELMPIKLCDILGVAWGEKDEQELIIGNAAAVQPQLYAGCYLRQDRFVTKVDCIIPIDEQRATIVCNDVLPRNRLIDWIAQTASSSRIAVINSSGNTTQVSIDLKSSGDIETHKLLALLVRYCLKRGRFLMDRNGLQISTTNQNFPVMHDEENSIFQTVFNLHGKILDNWIQYDQENQNYQNLTMCADPASAQEGNAKVRGFVI